MKHIIVRLHSLAIVGIGILMGGLFVVQGEVPLAPVQGGEPISASSEGSPTPNGAGHGDKSVNAMVDYLKHLVENRTFSPTQADFMGALTIGGQLQGDIGNSSNVSSYGSTSIGGSVSVTNLRNSRSGSNRVVFPQQSIYGSRFIDGTIETAHLEEGKIKDTDVDPSSIQIRTNMSCPAGHGAQAINEDGTLQCINIADRGA